MDWLKYDWGMINSKLTCLNVSMFVNPEDVVPLTKSIKIVVRLGFKIVVR